jgi:hypothetical protein
MPNVKECSCGICAQKQWRKDVPSCPHINHEWDENGEMFNKTEKWRLELVEDNPICNDAGYCHSVVIKYDQYPDKPKVEQCCCRCLAKFKVVML